MSNSVFFNEKNTEATLIESILASHYIIDYGYIKAVNTDGTIDVVHAKKLKLLNGEQLNQTITRQIEVLTLSGAGFSFKFDYKKGDKVLLLGLKNYIKKVGDVNTATETTAYQHYTRETLKAIPMCVFNGDAKVTMQIKNGDMEVKTAGKLTAESTKDTEIKADTLKVTTKKKVELNGNTKQFVTWAELNTALTGFVTQLSAALLGATYVNAAGVSTVLSWTGGTPPATLDISASKTTTVVTGG